MLRILDANLNRIGEGLRVLEDISRFTLNDRNISEQLKDLRHQLLPTNRAIQENLLSAREAQADVGAFLEVEGEGERFDTASLVSANSRRVQQSLRVIEEITKIPGQEFGFDWNEFKRSRFIVYELEQNILLQLTRRHKRDRLTGLYLILDKQALGDRHDADVARQALEGGTRSIQLRDKVRSKSELIPVSIELKRLCSEFNALFIVNDHLDVALAADADGLHIGQDDLPLPVARMLMPDNKIVGCSAATLDEAALADAQGADYVGVGSIYPSPSKPGTRIAGLEILRQVKDTVSIPVVAIGGINEDNVAGIMDAGADACAVISSVLGADDITEASRKLASLMEDR
ncbi:MAG: thiamine phosphate synthase [Dehalococcoidia bacterium]|nr:MAG: thiamine phosphate synthase [Dehalococcoidia bacterium]